MLSRRGFAALLATMSMSGEFDHSTAEREAKMGRLAKPEAFPQVPPLLGAGLRSRQTDC